MLNHEILRRALFLDVPTVVGFKRLEGKPLTLVLTRLSTATKRVPFWDLSGSKAFYFFLMWFSPNTIMYLLLKAPFERISHNITEHVRDIYSPCVST